MNINFKFHNIHFSACINYLNSSVSKFIDLMPVDNADCDGKYSKILYYALTNDRIKNIAVTGPYGSGKSSIIKTFEKNTPYKFLNISLASFKENPDTQDDYESQNILIERSILQQMLYGANADKLPYSRFKRISTPEAPLIKSIILILWALILFIIYTNKLYVLDSHILEKFYIESAIIIAITLSIPILLISDIYKSSFRISLKKISLTNAEIETGDIQENSILNKYIDEIIYFFQSTKYDVIVIEDLDRFGTPEIFVKLREINKLINDSEKTSGNIKFLYALKDDMFANKDRTKFFDFIIPIVPIINSSNSLDKMQERLKDTPYEDKIDSQFLRETSLYLDDLRLIHNIFNEFTIYHSKLKSNNLNATKLLATIIYKNVYPNDFELLHNNKGELNTVTKKRIELIKIFKKNSSHEIDDIKRRIELSKKEQIENIEEVIKLFFFNLFMSENYFADHISVNNDSPIRIEKFYDWEKFESLFGSQFIILYNNQNSQRKWRVNKSFEQIESAIRPEINIVQRKENIDLKQSSHQIKLEAQIRELEKERISITQLPLNKILQKSSVPIETIISEKKLGDSRLFIYLVKNGYLDETYHMYTSNFYEGRLTKNDRDYLLAIRDFKNPDPDQIIDTPDEVCKNMREDDFTNKYVLNVTLLDFILDDNSNGNRRIDSAISYISQNFNSSEDFFISYWNSGRNISKLTQILSEKWPTYAATSLQTTHASSHIASILSHIKSEYIASKMNQDGCITKYLSNQGSIVFSSELYSLSNNQILKDLDVKFTDLSSLDKLKTYIELSYTQNLYEINIDNILYLMHIYSNIKNRDQHESSNYSILSLLGCEKIKKYVDENILLYIKNVFLLLPENTNETHDAIKSLVNNKLIFTKTKKDIISKQKLVFDNFSDIPKELWEHLISEDKIVPSWKSLSEYLELQHYDAELITEKIQEKNWLEILQSSSISEDIGDSDQNDVLSNFIYNNNKLSLYSYSALIKYLPPIYDGFPDIDLDKKIAITQTKRIFLTENSFKSSTIDTNLQARLIENNAETYFLSKEKYPIDYDTIELLLRTDLSDDQKIELCYDITLSGLNHSENLTSLMTIILSSKDFDCAKFDREILKYLILECLSINNSISIFNKCIVCWDSSECIDIIKNLPEPYCEISLNGKMPKLEKNNENITLVKLLQNKELISSFKEEKDYIQVNTFKK